MKRIVVKILALFVLVSLYSTGEAQDVRLGNSWLGKTNAQHVYGINNQLYVRQADMQFRMFNFERTLLALENAVAEFPESADLYLHRARLRRIFGMETEADQDVAIASRLNPYAADLYGYNGIYGMMRILDTAPREAVVGLSLDRRLSYYYNMLDEEFAQDDHSVEVLDDLESAIQEFEAENLPEALGHLDHLIETSPDFAIAYDLKGMIYLKQQDWDGAEKALQKAVSLQPQFAIGWYNLSRLAQAKGEDELAKSYLDQAIALQEDLTKAYFDRALLLKKMGQQEAALMDYDKIIELRGEAYLEAYVNRGLTRKMLSDFTGALADLDKAVDAFPDDPYLLQNRGNLYLIFGHTFKAIQDYTQAIEINNDFAEAYYNRAVAHLIAYDKISACFDFGKSYELGYERAAEKQQYFCVE